MQRTRFARRPVRLFRISIETHDEEATSADFGVGFSLRRGGDATWLEDPAFQEKQSVGVHVFSPEGSAELPPVLEDALRVVSA